MNGYWLAACILAAALVIVCIADMVLKFRRRRHGR